MACEENCLSHTETDAEKQAHNKSELHSSPELWKLKRRHTHIKNKLDLNKKKRKKNTDLFYSVVFSSLSSAGGVWSLSASAVTTSECAC